jgi:uncharacterized repeat protein (TIGR01451 family)
MLPAPEDPPADLTAAFSDSKVFTTTPDGGPIQGLISGGRVADWAFKDGKLYGGNAETGQLAVITPNVGRDLADPRPVFQNFDFVDPATDPTAVASALDITTAGEADAYGAAWFIDEILYLYRNGGNNNGTPKVFKIDLQLDASGDPNPIIIEVVENVDVVTRNDGASFMAQDQFAFQCTGEPFIVFDFASQLNQIALNTGASTFTFNNIANPINGLQINNLGFRSTDGLLYGWERNATTDGGQIVQIDSTGAVTGLGQPSPALPANQTPSGCIPGVTCTVFNYNAGDVSVDGTKMYLSYSQQNGAGGKLYIVDLTAPTPLPRTEVDISGDSGPVADWAAHPTEKTIDGIHPILYGGARVANNSFHVARLDPQTGSRTNILILPVPASDPNLGYGAAWFDAAGRLFLYHNSGRIWAVDDVDTTPTLVAGPYPLVNTTLNTRNNDGANCAAGADPAPAIDLVKDGALDPGADGFLNVGDLINYTFTVTNTGSVTLTNVSVTDPLVPSIDCSPEENPIADLASQETVECTGSYSITQLDIDAGQRDNTATAEGFDPDNNPVSDQDSHSEDLLALTISKTAETSLDRTYTWNIDKTANWSSLTLMPGQSIQVTYEVAVNATSSDGNHAVSGEITIENNTTEDATIVSVTDQLSDGTVIPVCQGETFSYNLVRGTDLTCTYGAGLPDGNTRTNTATVTTSGLVSGGTATAPVDFASATVTEIDECIDVSDDNVTPALLGNVCANAAPKTFTYLLDIGPFYDPEDCGSDNFVTNTASFMTNDTGATGLDSHTIPITVDCDDGCGLTPGYWKTHSEYGPAPYDDTWALLADGADSPFFSSGQSYYEVLWTEPQGDAYYILAHAYIAAQLNFLNGANFTDAQADFDAATLLFQTYSPAAVSGAKGKNGKALREQFIALATTLDNYNNGLIGPGHCSEEEVYIVAGGGDISMHVGDLDASASLAKRARWNANVTITVHDESEGAVADATVSGLWSDGTSGSCPTNASGQCFIDRNNIRSGDSITFTVTDVAHGAFTYSAADNHDADGDSDGTSITVWKP